jgi:hypothetical protein
MKQRDCMFLCWNPLKHNYFTMKETEMVQANFTALQNNVGPTCIPVAKLPGPDDIRKFKEALALLERRRPPKLPNGATSIVESAMRDILGDVVAVRYHGKKRGARG